MKRLEYRIKRRRVCISSKSVNHAFRFLASILRDLMMDTLAASFNCYRFRYNRFRLESGLLVIRSSCQGLMRAMTSEKNFVFARYFEMLFYFLESFNI